MRFILSCLAAGLAQAKSDSIDTQLADLMTLQAENPAFGVWDQTNRQLLGVLKDMEVQHNIYKNNKTTDNAKNFAHSQQLASNAI